MTLLAALHSYPAYRPSGVEWLGDVPAHWEARRLRHILTQSTTKNRPDLPLLSVVRDKGVIERDLANTEENHNFVPDDLSNYKMVKAGQFAINKMKAWQGSYGVSRFDGIVSPAYFVFDVTNITLDFFDVAVRSQAYVPFFASNSIGIRVDQWDLSLEYMREIPCLVPPLAEQRAIVRYLDYVDRRIRRYAGAKRRLIALLEEEKQAAVNRAVTCGLDPNVRLKPSGVQWLGDVPAHWEVRRLKTVGQLVAGSAFPLELQGLIHEIIPFYKVNNLSKARNGRHLISSSNTISHDTAIQLRASVLPADAIVYAKIGAALLLNRRRILAAPACIDNNMTGFVPDSRLLTSLWAFFALSQVDFAEHVNPGAIPSFSEGDQARLAIPLPPLAEQRAIVEHLDEATAAIDTAIARARRQIELVEEYRARLVADVVTGKLDVREAAARLPEEAAEGEEGAAPAVLD